MSDIVVGTNGNRVITESELEKCKDDCNKTHYNMSEKIEEVKESVHKVELKIEGLPEVLLEKFEKKFASKNAEYIVYGMVAIILVAVIGYWVDQAIKRPVDTLTTVDVQKLIEENNNKILEANK